MESGSPQEVWTEPEVGGGLESEWEQEVWEVTPVGVRGFRKNKTDTEIPS